jgi:hypothetical protein
VRKGSKSDRIDAFTQYQYYLNLFLLCPFLIFAVAGIFRLLGHQWVVGAE